MNEVKEKLVCYLCGKEIDSDAPDELDRLSDDHVPARVFYPKKYRRNGELKRNLPKAPAHKRCNFRYKKDEEYFAMVLSLSVSDQSKAGRELFEDLRHQIAKYPTDTNWFFRKVLNKIRYVVGRTPMGLILPKKMMVIPQESERLQNVIWKVARGLHFLNHKKVLPETHPFYAHVYRPGEPLDSFLTPYLEVSAAGVHPEIFVYKYSHHVESPKGHMIIMRFWEALHFVVTFHGMDCDCTKCIKQAAG